ncbi:hypothetical protein [Cohnella mopanensis]|uniref:hypothetical protein n=1 Tax=Cohnella mopanensis TaxID=2911966 RepID=UPI001EF862DC|nr:hypothetical protein [Cohnella mopanensis]
MRIPTAIQIDLRKSAVTFLGNQLNCSRNEVSMLESIHKDIHLLGNTWKNILANQHGLPVQLSISSYFIHQTPQVSYTGIQRRKRIEFGDVLYIYKEMDKQQIIRENALLLQAKLWSQNAVDKAQLQLYLSWPTFWYTTANIHNKHFNVDSQPYAHPGARYLFLDNSHSNRHFASTGTPLHGLKANQHDAYLETDLVDLLQFKCGKELHGDWGEAIKALQKHVSERKPSYHRVSRENQLMYLETAATSLFNPNEELNMGDSRGFWLVTIRSWPSSIEELPEDF